MVKVIMGLAGSGKTKHLVQAINEAVKTEAGAMVCIEKGGKLKYDIDYRVRLVDAREYDQSGYVFLRGMICGLHAGNLDISHIFIDNLLKISGNEDPQQTLEFVQWCERFGKAQNVHFTIAVSSDPDKAIEELQKYI